MSLKSSNNNSKIISVVVAIVVFLTLIFIIIGLLITNIGKKVEQPLPNRGSRTISPT
jgi:hypothetical protein